MRFENISESDEKNQSQYKQSHQPTIGPAAIGHIKQWEQRKTDR